MLEELLGLGEDAVKVAGSSAGCAAPGEGGVDSEELVACLRAARRLEQVAVLVQASLTRQANAHGLPAEQGFRSTPAWLRAVLCCDPGPARALAELAEALRRHPGVEQACVAGRTDTQQATVIGDALDELGRGLNEREDVGLAEAGDITQRAEAAMVELADRLPAYQLRRVGERILEHVAPQVAERFEERALARDEERAYRKRGFTLCPADRSSVQVSGALTAEDAAVVAAALDPLCAPAPDDERSPAQRRADALIEVCRLAMRPGDLPDSGGEPAHVTVTLAYDPLTRALGTATTDRGERLSAETARRMACDARIVPAVLGGEGEVLDLARLRRSVSTSLRRALGLRDGGCAFPDCDRPPRWTDVHHVKPWSEGGETKLDNLVLLCRHHHRLLHDPASGWEIRFGADRKPDFIPPAHIDPLRRPRRNLYHLRP